MTKLVANAWDTGATIVDIFIPEKIGEKLVIEDNGIGLTKKEFYSRWMKLGYNRLKHQGKKVKFPKGVDLQRYAYGRNGVGRHGMLCFNNEYEVITCSKGKQSYFTVTTKSGKEPFIIKSEQFNKASTTGTRLIVKVQKNLPKPEHILEVISARFLKKFKPLHVVKIYDICKKQVIVEIFYRYNLILLGGCLRSDHPEILQ